MLQITTLLSDISKGEAAEKLPAAELEALRAEVARQGGVVKEAKGDRSGPEAKARVEAEVKVLLQLKERLAVSRGVERQGA